MNKKKLSAAIILTVLVAAALAVIAGLTINRVNQRARENSFAELAGAAREQAADLRRSVKGDCAVLGAMAGMIAMENGMEQEKLLPVMNSFTADIPYIEYVELLLPNGRVLEQDGTILEAGGALDFEAEKKRGQYISGKCESVRDPGSFVIRSAVPVLRNGETAAILYGVVPLDGLQKKYTTSLYGDKAYVYLVDGDTGDFLVDAWHKTLGNINEMGTRETLPEYRFVDLVGDIKNGEAGQTGFVSKTTGQILYMQYAPVGINNWSVMLTVDEQSALAGSEEISRELYHMSAVIGVTLIAYMLIITISLYQAYRDAYRRGHEDNITQLKNRTAFEAYIQSCREHSFDSITCVYLDANGLHETNNTYGHDAGDQLLRTIAMFLKREFSYKNVYRVGGDEFVVFYDGERPEECPAKMLKVVEELETRDYSISYGLVCLKNEIGLSRIVKKADEEMLENKKEYYREHGIR